MIIISIKFIANTAVLRLYAISYGQDVILIVYCSQPYVYLRLQRFGLVGVLIS